MRITGGKACGIQLDVPQGKGVRPATDFTREQVFNRLGNMVWEACVLDCFAGTGAYGLECLSRGCKSVHFLEKDVGVAKTLRKNCARVCKSACIDYNTVTTISAIDVFRAPLKQFADVQIIFLDPPYGYWQQYVDALNDLLRSLAQRFRLAVLILETPSEITLPQDTLWTPVTSLRSTSSKKKGTPSVNFYKVNTALQHTSNDCHCVDTKIGQRPNDDCDLNCHQ
ncbi:MAG: RsmD family RNA methyltransferase [Puniceicoccales bacterium]|jgi:16S rRNA (guanine(966)-N(2))-methyltransferase RsmD|nr:RsmD family RNA methyltransferase [Puniceicoccales bacterium]